jgi:hypothetical protein
MLLWNCGSGRDEEAAAKILRLIQIRIATASFQKILAARQANSPQARIPHSSSNKSSQFLIRRSGAALSWACAGFFSFSAAAIAASASERLSWPLCLVPLQLLDRTTLGWSLESALAGRASEKIPRLGLFFSWSRVESGVFYDVALSALVSVLVR